MNSDLETRLRAHFSTPGARPLNKSELARALNISPRERAEMRKILRHLERDGVLVSGKKGRYQPTRDDRSLLEGKLYFPRTKGSSRAFFVPNPPASVEFEGERLDRIAVPIHRSRTSMHGDQVRVKIHFPKPRGRQQGRPRPGRRPSREALNEPEGEVLEILERGNPRIVGTYVRSGKFHQLLPDLPHLPDRFDLASVLPEARSGDKVLAEFMTWDSHRTRPRARMTQILGSADDPKVEILGVIHKHQLPLEFPAKVLAEADSVAREAASDGNEPWREDWRERDVFTIDPFDAKDFDDAICVTPDAETNQWELAVHIADVSHFVPPGSELDREASKRGNSVYLVDRVIPMLPEVLSNGLCSLVPGEDRCTFAAIMRFDHAGRMISARFTPAVIRSRRRYTYEEAYTRLNLTPREAKAFPEHEAHFCHQLHLAWDLASRLRARRFRQGALDLDFPESRVVVDQKGRAVNVVKVENDESHQLIEEFMLAANEAVARVTREAAAPSLYRVHEDPDPDKLLDYRDEALGYGYQVGDLTHRPELQKLLRQVAGKPEEHALKIGLLKSLKRACYSPDSLGHFGLAKRNYTHFTSPIRRYADLIVHRVLRRHLARRAPDNTTGETAPPPRVPSPEKLGQIAEHLSETERTAADAEQETQRLKLMEYLLRLAKEDSRRSFEAVVTEVRPFGAFVELTEIFCKGMIRREDLPGHDVYYDAARSALASRSPRFRIHLGQKLQVRVERVDRERQLIDFLPAG